MAELSISPDEIRSALSEFASAYEPGAAQKTEVGYVTDAADGIVIMAIVVRVDSTTGSDPPVR